MALLLDPKLRTDAAYAATANERQHSPTPRVKEGALIGALGEANAMIDVSDGVEGDLHHICEKSRVSARVVAEKLPVGPETGSWRRPRTRTNGTLRSREEKTTNFDHRAAGARGEAGAADHLGDRTPVAIIGEILPVGQPAELVLPDGKRRPLGGGGWDHFKWKKL